MNKATIALSLMFPALTCSAEPERESESEEIVMHEYVTALPHMLTFGAHIGSDVGDITVTVFANQDRTSLQSATIEYGGRTIEVGPELLGCVPNPIIADTHVIYTHIGNRSVTANQWNGHIRIPYWSGDNGSRSYDEEDHTEFEIRLSNFKVTALVVHRYPELDMKWTKDLDQGCPKDIIQWGLSDKPRMDPSPILF